MNADQLIKLIEDSEVLEAQKNTPIEDVTDIDPRVAKIMSYNKKTFPSISIS